MSRYNRADATFGGYAAALGVVVLIVLAMALVVAGRSREHIPSIDYTADLVALQDVAPYGTYAPEELPEGWVPTSTRLDTGGALPGEEPAGPVSWTLGFATPEDRHAEFAISDADPEAFVAAATENGAADGTAEVGGGTWDRYWNEAENRRALVRQEDGATVVVAGSAEYAELAVLAASLRPGAGG
ncbi:DUF4245 domain-containing protein [Marinitenerispora sediminis]|uniref:DUF4245 domain-containing protein n=1 Tax=Marinitenerispora sediminis TaxID=1931232 RepID=A0A368TBA9_9ACTN|nr:DUF4245 domain-containing protein [Marinitenerispora sediminis]RCV54393.1 DUF4245 domain-containing protein [Marinitenerispora sediminis]RCV61122.1 DUF4245 domain-containing protein [Marinitenerispora sediminis]RCV62398.1 DUF4245 domain-containing protein [Marinitenerispora sediminis]